MVNKKDDRTVLEIVASSLNMGVSFKPINQFIFTLIDE